MEIKLRSEPKPLPPEDSKPHEEKYLAPAPIGNVVKAKILVQLWDSHTDRPKLITQRLVKYGIPYCRVKVGGDKRRYWINYNQLKEGKKHFIYMTEVSNSVGSITFQGYEKEKVDPYQAELMLNEGLAETFVRAKTYPLWYILIGLIGMVIALAILAWLFPAYFNSQQQEQLDQSQIVSQQHSIKDLQTQLTTLKNASPLGH